MQVYGMERAARSVVRIIGIVMLLLAFYALGPMGAGAWLMGLLGFILIMLS